MFDVDVFPVSCFRSWLVPSSVLVGRESAPSVTTLRQRSRSRKKWKGARIVSSPSLAPTSRSRTHSSCFKTGWSTNNKIKRQISFGFGPSFIEPLKQKILLTSVCLAKTSREPATNCAHKTILKLVTLFSNQKLYDA